MSQFSPQLNQQIKKYFADRYGILLTDEQAEEYLNSWADLVLAVSVGSLQGPRSALTVIRNKTTTRPISYFGTNKKSLFTGLFRIF